MNMFIKGYMAKSAGAETPDWDFGLGDAAGIAGTAALAPWAWKYGVEPAYKYGAKPLYNSFTQAPKDGLRPGPQVFNNQAGAVTFSDPNYYLGPDGRPVRRPSAGPVSKRPPAPKPAPTRSPYTTINKAPAPKPAPTRSPYTTINKAPAEGLGDAVTKSLPKGSDPRGVWKMRGHEARTRMRGFKTGFNAPGATPPVTTPPVTAPVTPVSTGAGLGAKVQGAFDRFNALPGRAVQGIGKGLSHIPGATKVYNAANTVVPGTAKLGGGAISTAAAPVLALGQTVSAGLDPDSAGGFYDMADRYGQRMRDNHWATQPIWALEAAMGVPGAIGKNIGEQAWGHVDTLNEMDNERRRNAYSNKRFADEMALKRANDPIREQALADERASYDDYKRRLNEVAGDSGKSLEVMRERSASLANSDNPKDIREREALDESIKVSQKGMDDIQSREMARQNAYDLERAEADERISAMEAAGTHWSSPAPAQAPSPEGGLGQAVVERATPPPPAPAQPQAEQAPAKVHHQARLNRSPDQIARDKETEAYLAKMHGATDPNTGLRAGGKFTDPATTPGVGGAPKGGYDTGVTSKNVVDFEGDHARKSRLARDTREGDSPQARANRYRDRQGEEFARVNTLANRKR